MRSRLKKLQTSSKIGGAYMARGRAVELSSKAGRVTNENAPRSGREAWRVEIWSAQLSAAVKGSVICFFTTRQLVLASSQMPYFRVPDTDPEPAAVGM